MHASVTMKSTIHAVNPFLPVSCPGFELFVNLYKGWYKKKNENSKSDYLEKLINTYIFAFHKTFWHFIFNSNMFLININKINPINCISFFAKLSDFEIFLFFYRQLGLTHYSNPVQGMCKNGLKASKCGFSHGRCMYEC